MIHASCLFSVPTTTLASLSSCWEGVPGIQSLCFLTEQLRSLVTIVSEIKDQ